jgi:hypothetical protein
MTVFDLAGDLGAGNEAGKNVVTEYCHAMELGTEPHVSALIGKAAPMEYPRQITEDPVRSSKRAYESSKADIARMWRSIHKTQAKIARSQKLIKKLGTILENGSDKAR